MALEKDKSLRDNVSEEIAARITHDNHAIHIAYKIVENLPNITLADINPSGNEKPHIILKNALNCLGKDSYNEIFDQFPDAVLSVDTIPDTEMVEYLYEISKFNRRYERILSVIENVILKKDYNIDVNTDSINFNVNKTGDDVTNAMK